MADGGIIEGELLSTALGAGEGLGGFGALNLAGDATAGLLGSEAIGLGSGLGAAGSSALGATGAGLGGLSGSGMTPYMQAINSGVNPALAQAQGIDALNASRTIANPAMQQIADTNLANQGFSKAELDAINAGQTDALNAGKNAYAPTAGTTTSDAYTNNPLVKGSPEADTSSVFKDTVSYQAPASNTPLPSDATSADVAKAATQMGKSSSWLNDFTTWWSGLKPMEKALYGGGAGLGALMAYDKLYGPKYGVPAQQKYTGPLSKFNYNPSTYSPNFPTPNVYTPHYADGGIAGLAESGMFPTSQQQNPRYAVPSQMPVGASDVRMANLPPTAMKEGGDAGIAALKTLMASRNKRDKYKSQLKSDPSSVMANAKSGDYDAMLTLNDAMNTPNQNYAHGGISSLGGYSDGGRMLKGPGDGMSDNIPATIGGKQPARLADGEFVVPADVVSHLGNGSTDAGAKQLYAMMDKVRQARTGRKAQGKQINPKKYMPK